MKRDHHSGLWWIALRHINKPRKRTGTQYAVTHSNGVSPASIWYLLLPVYIVWLTCVVAVVCRHIDYLLLHHPYFRFVDNFRRYFRIYSDQRQDNHSKLCMCVMREPEYTMKQITK